jgi:hypothetical protein
MRGFFGATGRINNVTLDDPRRKDLRELFIDLSRPGLCIVLGAGSSHGVIPITPRQIAELARELIDARDNRSDLPGTYLDQIENPQVMFLVNMLRQVDRGAWDRVLAEFLSPGKATFILNEIFAPRGKVPSALLRIYKVLENERGVIVSYNYDRITDGQKRFRVITPHGQRSGLFADSHTIRQRRWRWNLTFRYRPTGGYPFRRRKPFVCVSAIKRQYVHGVARRQLSSSAMASAPVRMRSHSRTSERMLHWTLGFMC